MYDIIVIGAGVIGSFIAHELSRKQCSVLVIDKEADIADGASMANSAIVHAGYDPKPGTLKARLNVRGNRMYPDICRELGETFVRSSAFVVATDEDESRILDTLASQARDRDIEYRDLDGDSARELEPNLTKNVIRVLEFPTTGIIYPWNIAIALMEEAILNGVELKLSEEVTAIDCIGQGVSGESGGPDAGGQSAGDHIYRVTTSRGLYEASRVINAAGVYADRIYGMAMGGEPDFHIRPRRGEYYVLDEMKIPVVSRVIYPVPGPNGKGVLVVPTIHNNVLIGPNSLPIDDKEANCNTSDALADVRARASKTVDNIPFDKVIRTFAGLRPSGDTGDFVIEESAKLPGFINAACIESPGLASAPAIAEYVIDEILNGAYEDKAAEDFVHRKPPVRMNELSDDEKNRIIREDPDYGDIVCRCCLVSKGEIRDAIRRPAGATTVKGVKKRVGPGLGRCQGGFCEPLVVDILSEELGVDKTEVRYDSEASIMLTGETKKGAL